MTSVQTLTVAEIAQVSGGYSNKEEYVQMLYEAGGHVEGRWAYWPSGQMEWLPDLFPDIGDGIQVIFDGYDAGGKPVYRIY